MNEEDSLFLKAISNSIAAITWTSLNIVACYVYFAELYKPITSALTLFIGNTFTVAVVLVAVVSSIAVNIIVFSFLVNSYYRSIDKEKNSSTFSEVLIPIALAFQIILITYIFTIQIINAIGYSVDVNFLNWSMNWW